MMKTLWIERKINYDGSALQPLYAYTEHRTAGDSIVAFAGKCDVQLEHMIDAEDFVVSAKIQADHMLHFIVEVFNQNLMTAVSLQRLLVAIAKDLLPQKLRRDGDDLYIDHAPSRSGPIGLKLSVSIASVSAVSAMIHLGLNIRNEGTPVPTCSLEDLGVEAATFAKQLMEKFSSEYASIVEATQKVRPL